MTVVGVMIGFKYQYCKRRMVAYINGELDDRARRRVARYVDSCPRCYAEYQRQRELQRELAADLPSFGRPQAAQLDRIWSAVTADLATPPRRHPQPYLRVRYGVVMMLFITAMIFPLVFGSSAISQAAATPPTPAESQTVSALLVTEAAAATQVPDVEPTRQAVETAQVIDETQAISTPNVAPQRTPAATP